MALHGSYVPTGPIYTAPEVPPLTIAEEKIPEFDIKEANANEPDPNQAELPIGFENNNDASLMKKINTSKSDDTKNE